MFILLLLIGFSLACLLSDSGASALVLKDESLPAHLYSNVLAGLLAVVSVLRLGALFVRRGAAEGTGKREPMALPSTLLIAGCSVFYTLGISYMGFYVSTFVFMFVLFLGFENWRKDRVKTGLVFSLGLCAIFFVSFYFLKIYLPDGLLF